MVECMYTELGLVIYPYNPGMAVHACNLSPQEVELQKQLVAGLRLA